MLRDDAAVLDFGFLPAATSADAAGAPHLSTVDLPAYMPGCLQRVREFADSCADSAAAGPADADSVADGRSRVDGVAAMEADRLRRRLAAFPTTASQDAELLMSKTLSDTERLIIAFRLRRKLALAAASNPSEGS